MTAPSTGAVTNGLVQFTFSGAHTRNGFNIDDVTATGTAMDINTNALSSGIALTLSSSSTALTSGGLLSLSATGAPGSSWTGDRAKIEYNSTDADVDGSALKLGLVGTTALGSGTTLNITSEQTGTGALVLRVNDDGTYTDSTPFLIDVAGNVGIGTTTASEKLTIAGNATISGTLALGPLAPVDAGTCTASIKGKQYWMKRKR